jgi:hypothetical protein
MRFSLKWILAVMVYVAVAAAAFGQPKWLYPDIMWCITILANAFAAAIAVCGRGPRKAAASAFLVASITFAALVLFSVDLPGHDGHSGFYPVDNIFLTLGIDSAAPTPNTVLRLRTANAIAPLVFGLLGALVGLIAFRAADCGDDQR